jgi:hypothetical protein
MFRGVDVRDPHLIHENAQIVIEPEESGKFHQTKVLVFIRGRLKKPAGIYEVCRVREDAIGRAKVRVDHVREAGRVARR